MKVGLCLRKKGLPYQNLKIIMLLGFKAIYFVIISNKIPGQ